MAKAATAWNLDAADYPASGPLRAQLEFLLRYAILAPSTHKMMRRFVAARGACLRRQDPKKITAPLANWLGELTVRVLANTCLEC